MDPLSEASLALFNLPLCKRGSLVNVGPSFSRAPPREKKKGVIPWRGGDGPLSWDDDSIFINTKRHPFLEIEVNKEIFISEFVYRFLCHNKDFLKYAALDHVAIPIIARGRQLRFIEEAKRLMA